MTSSTEDMPPPTQPDTPLVRDEPRRGIAPGYFYAALGVTAVAAIGWGVSGGLALSANSDFETANQLYVNNTGAANANELRAQAVERADTARQYALWSDIAMGVTLAGVAASAVLFFKTDFSRNRVEVAAMPTPQGGVFGLSGRF